MQMIWTGLAISALVAVVFYVLAAHWRGILIRNSRAIGTLLSRIEALERVADPRFRKRIGDSTPSPLEHVYIFSFRLADDFWFKTLRVTSEELREIRARGVFLSSVKIERWRSHISIIVTEILPTAGWQTRTINLYPTRREECTALIWELHFQASGSEEFSRALQLVFEPDEIILREAGALETVPAKNSEVRTVRNIFRVPFDAVRLAQFEISRETTSFDSEDAFEDGGAGGPDSAEFSRASRGGAAQMSAWVDFYRCDDEARGFAWELCVRDLDGKKAWEGANPREAWEARRVS